jgi:hypothetical protein
VTLPICHSLALGGPVVTGSRHLCPATDGEPGRSASVHVAAAVKAAWSAAWDRLRAECPDVEDRLASLPAAVHRLEASAGRWGARVLRGEADLLECEAKIADWADAVLGALAGLDQARSERLCIDCAADDVPTVAPGLTGGRVCARCLREATP